MNWLQLGGSLAAVLILAGIAWALKLGRGDGHGTIDDAESAAHAAEEALSGFVAVGALVSENRAAGLVAGSHGRVAVVKRHGARLAVREVAWSAVRSTHAGIEIETRDRRFGTITLDGVNVLDVRRLAPSLTSV